MLTALLLIACDREPPDRVVVFGIDGLERSFVEAQMAAGALPAFSKLYAQGAVVDLATQSPSSSPAIWTTLASGYAPEVHGVPGWSRADGSVPSGADVRADRIWNRVSQDDQPVVVSGWLMTWPAEQVQGALLSERLVWHKTPDRYDPETRVPENLLKRRREGATWPADLAEPVARLMPTRAWLSTHRQAWQLESLGRGHHPLPKDETHLRAFERLFDPLEARLGAVYWIGVDPLSHLYWPFVVPEAVATLQRDPSARQLAHATHPAAAEGSEHKYFPWIDAPITQDQLDEGRRWIEDAYAAVDDALARVMALVDPETTTLIVLSDHGFQAGARLPVLDARHRDVGLLAVWGRRARPGGQAAGARLEDVAPTLCALLGVDAGADMPGRTLTTLVDVDPAQRGASWVRSDWSPVAAEPVPPALQEQLEALGYVE